MPHQTAPRGIPGKVRSAIEIMGNAARTEILRHLARGPMTIAQLADVVGAAGPSIHRHLKVLEDAGLVTADRPPGSRFGPGGAMWRAAPDRISEMAAEWARYATGE